MSGLPAGRRRFDESGSVAYELVLLVPVLVLLTLFVLWAGRGGRAELSADLAAEEAATAASLCCEEGVAGEPDRDLLVEEILEARPWLEFLCVGGLRPQAPPDSGAEPEFVTEHWVDFEPAAGVRTGGVGILGVQFECETDGAVAPLRGLFPTVTFQAHATEVVPRRPPPLNVGFAATTFRSIEGAGGQLVFTLSSFLPMPQDAYVQYNVLLPPDTTATAGTDYQTLPREALFPAGATEADIVVNLLDDNLYEGTEILALELFDLTDNSPARVQLPPAVAQLDLGRLEAVGEIADDEQQPHLFLYDQTPPCESSEGDPAGAGSFVVRLRDAANTAFAPSAATVTVDLRTEDIAGEAVAGTDYTALPSQTLTFNPGITQQPATAVTVQTTDDSSSPEAEADETFKVLIENPGGAPLGTIAGATEATCVIIDNEATLTVADVRVTEGDLTATPPNPGDPLTFELALDKAIAAPVTFRYALEDIDPLLLLPQAQRGGATCAAGDDYLENSNTIPISPHPTPGQTPDPVDLVVTICDDDLPEPDEAFWLKVEWVSGEAVVEADGGAKGTIVDNDTPHIVVADASEVEDQLLEFNVSLEVRGSPANLAAQIDVDYAIAEDSPVSARQGIDYAAAAGPPPTPLTGTLSFGPGPTTAQTLPVQLLADYLVEGDETFTAAFSDADTTDAVSLTTVAATGTIQDDPPPVLSIASDWTGAEGTTQTFTVELTDPRPGETVEVDYAITGNTADDPTQPNPDFDTVPSVTAVPPGSLTGTLTFAPGTTSHTVQVALLHDTIIETDETLRLTLENPDKAVLFDRDPNNNIDEPYRVGTITNIDPPEITVDDPTAAEGETMTFTVELVRGRSGETAGVDYQVLSRSAKSTLDNPGAPDYTAVAGGKLTLDSDNPTATVDVQILSDKIAENPETLHLVLHNVVSTPTPNHVAISKAIGVGIITDVVPATVRVTNPASTEGDPLQFEITLVDDQGRPAATSQAVTVWYHTEDRSATAPGSNCAAPNTDYLPLSVATVSFAASDSPSLADRTRTVAVDTCRDTDDENDETMALVLSVDPNNHAATLGDAEGTGTIEDQPPPRIRIDNPAAVREGEDVVFTVSLYDENGTPTTTSEEVRVQHATGDRTATAGADYAPASGTVTFMPGDQQRPITVTTLADGVWEPDETFRVDLTRPSNAILDAAVGTGTIAADCIDVQSGTEVPDITVEDVTADETGSVFPVRIGYSRPLCDSYELEWSYVEGTATDEIASLIWDFYYDPPLSLNPWGPVTFNARHSREDRHEIHRSALADDDIDEPDEEFYVDVVWGAGMPARFQGRPAARGVFTIVDDDPPSTLRVADAAAEAGDPITFEVTLDRPSGHEVTVFYETADHIAVEPADYQAESGTLTFPPGATAQTFDVQTELNIPSEDDETFWVLLSNAANANFDDAAALGTILAGPGPSLRIYDADADEGDTMQLRVELSPASAQTVTVDYSTVERSGDGAADEGGDYQPASDTLTFMPGDTEKLIDVVIIDDDEDEVAETFLVELTNPSAGVSLADPSAVGTINGDIVCVDRSTSSADPMPAASVDGTTADEDEGSMDMTITVTQPMCQRYEFEFQVWSPVAAWRHGTTAVLGEDFLEPREVTLAAGETEVDFYVGLIDDDLVEGNENFRLRAGSGSLPGRRNMGEVNRYPVIVDDDVATLQLPAAGETSTDEGGFLSFVVRLDKPTAALPITFDYEVTAGPDPAATAGADFAPVSGSATIPAGQLSTTVSVRTAEDRLDEHDENVLFSVSNIEGAQPDPNGDTAIGVIVDDDIPPSARVSDPTADEGGSLVFEVTLDAPSGRATTVYAATRDSTATAGSDYVALPRQQLTIPHGQTRHTVAVETLGDDTVEDTETVYLDLDTPGFLALDDATGAGRIRDATQRSVSASDAFVVEGGTLRFSVGFAGEPFTHRDIVLDYRTVADSAAAGDDYDDSFEVAAGKLRIVAGATSATAEVTTVQDGLDEDTERLLLVLSNPRGAVIADGEAAGVIIDDDPLPALSVGNAEATENPDGTPITFTVTLSEPSGRDVEVLYSTQDGAAAAGDDFAGIADEPLAIPAGETMQTVDVPLVDDDVAEDLERFQLVLSDPDNATLDDSVGIGSILDDDGLIQIVADDAEPAYEAAGATSVFTVRLSRADPDNPVTVDYATEDASATHGDDYTSISPAMTLTFASGETTKTVAVGLVNDDEVEETETFRLLLENPSANAELGDDDATAVIYDDDALPTVSADDDAAAEGETAVFEITLSKPSTRDVTVTYATVPDPTAGPAAAVPALDFIPASGTLTIAAGATTATVDVSLVDDSLNEATETFWLRLTGPTGATILDGTATGTIADNDPLPSLAIADTSAIEGQTLRFEVRLDTPSGRTVTVPWATVARTPGPDSAQPGQLVPPEGDYIASSSTLVFNSGSTLAHIEVATIEDDISESDEQFFVHLGEPTGATLDDSAAVGTIDDNDGRPRVWISDTTVNEDNSPAIFTVTVNPASSKFLSIEYATADGTATAGDDYGTATATGATGTLVIAPEVTTGEISVFVADDELAEGTETFTITITGNTDDADVTEGGHTATGYILDDDVTRVSIGDAQAAESEPAIGFPVTLSAASTEIVTVRYTTFDGTAAQPDDYTAATATLTIPPGDTSATIAVALTDDIYVEETESFLVRLSDISANAEIADDEALGVIADDDNLPEISVNSPNLVEGDGPLIWRVTLSHESDLEVTVDYTSTGWSSGCTGSAPTVTGTLTFEPGSTTETVTVPVTDDSVACNGIGGGGLGVWPVRDVYFTLSNPVNAELPSPWGQGQIHDDDGKTLLSIKARNRGGLLASESDGQLVFDLELGRPFGFDVTVPIRIDETQALESLIPPGPGWYDSYVSGPQATAGSDFVARNEDVTLPAGEVLVEVAVQIIDDNSAEDTEAFMALLPSQVYDYFIAFNHLERARIVDNDSVSVSAEDVEVLESAGAAVFRLQLDRDNTQTVTVQYTTADGTATHPDDYTQTSGTATFDAGTRSVFVSVPIVDDEEEDADETFELQLSGAVGATISDNSATATIRDDDGDDNLPVITIADASATESAHDNVSHLCFSVTTTDHPGDPIMVDFEPLEAPWLGTGAATPGVDYGIPSFGTNTRHLHSAETSICVNIFNDNIPEPDEMFIGWLSNPVDAVLGNSMAWGTIIDRDPPIASVSDATASESDGAVVFTIQLHAPDLEPSSLAYTTVVRSSEGDAAASPGDDYITTSGTLDIPAGATTATITVPLIADTADELDETFLLELSNPTNLEFRDRIAVGTITDDDDGWTIDDPSVWEYAGSIDFTVARDHTSADAVTVDYTITPAGSATGGTSCADPGVDYETPTGSVTLQPTDTSATVVVALCDDDTAEGSETLILELAGVTGRDLIGIATIIDDDDGVVG